MDRRTTRRLLGAIQEENARAFEGLHIRGHKRPHFLSHLVRHREEWILEARFGALSKDVHTTTRTALVDVRVGSYRRDQIANGGLHDNSRDLESYEWVQLPFGSSGHGFRHALWRLTEVKYREACDDLLHKKAVELNYLDPSRKLGALERREPVQAFELDELPAIDHEHWVRYVTKLSAAMKRLPMVRDGDVRFRATNQVRVFVSSEGATVVESNPQRAIDVYLWYLAPDGHTLPYSKTFFVTDETELPTEAQLKQFLRRIHRRLETLSKAPVLRSYAGPVLLDPTPAGLLVHEAIGHRLEGSRLLSQGEGQTFRDSVNSEILLPGIDIWDDPTLSTFQGRTLTGHYAYDDEGVRSSRANLVEDGVLRGFLTTRSPIAKGHVSNGHARSAHHGRAISRMGVTVMEAHHGLDDDALMAAFLDEIRAQGAPYGLRILEASSGETSTDAYDFQAFLGDVDLAARVFPDGRQELVRGLDLVGTPLNAVRSIIAAGARQEVDNAWCGAESGYVPVTTIAPSLLVDELELQAKPMRPMTQFAYPMPWEG
ncbi:MAG: hypothetical protein JJ863_01995 [Deltaproteobacteria bacterium]|nr:hypothetical protein [Deltaproteobacteria bacterium]